jgi:hypothetical protein
MILGLCGVLAGCSWGANEGAGPAPYKQRHYAGKGYTFTYPAAWRYQRGGFVSTETSPIIDLATQPMGDPCHGSLGCGWPVMHLRPGGVVVMVWGGPMFTDKPEHARLTFRSYRIAHSGVPRNGVDDTLARSIGCDKVFTATYQLNSTKRGGGYVGFSACARAPGLATDSEQFHTMAESLRKRGGP